MGRHLSVGFRIFTIAAPHKRSMRKFGEVAERLNVPDSKSGVGASLPRVRIPPSPPNNTTPAQCRGFCLRRNEMVCDQLSRLRHFMHRHNVITAKVGEINATSYSFCEGKFTTRAWLTYDSFRAKHEATTSRFVRLIAFCLSPSKTGYHPGD